MKELEIADVQITDGFWKEYQKLIVEKVIPYQWDIFNDRVPGIEKSHAIDNFRILAGVSEGDFYGFVFQDSDLYKWLEAVGNALQVKRDPVLEAKADEVIDLLAAAQEKDGYLNSYYQLVEPEKKWTNILECHELYCAGHLIEAAIAYFKGTRKEKILRIACRFADCIDSKFGEGEGKLHGYPGHQEIELALIRLFDLTKEERYLKLAGYFINTRGTNRFFEEEFEKRKRICHWTQSETPEPNRRYNQFSYREYNQFHEPVRLQTKAVGHAVRAVYMYTAMADLAYHTHDKELLRTCRTLWNNITEKQMYINGSIGSTPSGEAFTRDYDLPGDTNYSETCASLGMIFFSEKMLKNCEDSRYADLIEHELYNAVLPGLGIDGEHFFYANPLEMIPERARNNTERNHLKAVRQKWYACACCPPNIARTLASLGKYIYGVAEDDNVIFINQYISSDASLIIKGSPVRIKMMSSFPNSGKVSVTVSGGHGTKLAIRRPGWAKGAWIVENGHEKVEDVNGFGYMMFDLGSRDMIDIEFEMYPSIIAANRKLSYNARRVALRKGPLLYCLESADNGENIRELGLCTSGHLEVERGYLAGKKTDWILADGIRRIGLQGDILYGEYKEKKENIKLKAIPYYLWNNRGEGEMTVWIPVE